MFGLNKTFFFFKTQLIKPFLQDKSPGTSAGEDGSATSPPPEPVDAFRILRNLRHSVSLGK